MKRVHRWGAALAAAVLVAGTAAACGNDEKAPGDDGGGHTIAVVTHGSAGDAFWDVVKKGAEAAGKTYGDKVNYQASGNPQEQAQFIDAAVTQKVDGLVVSMANPDALSESIRKAVAAGIPVVTINSGADKAADLGVLGHVGQTEDVAGEGAGRKLADAGVKKVVCVIHEAGNIGLEQRCDGAKKALGGNVTNLQVDINNVAEAQNTIKSKLQADPSVDGVLALNPAVGTAATQAVADAKSSAKVATFDLSGDVIDAVLKGTILFAVDQQQYLQGYLPVTMIEVYLGNANIVGGGLPVLTGPGFVTKDNAARVKDLAEKGTR